MKVIATLSLASYASAGIKKMMNEVAIGVNKVAALDRNINTVVGDDAFANIDQYGCWCYFDEDHGAGKGSPVDGLDRVCKTLSHCYDCAILDIINDTGADTCVPYEVSYLSGAGFGIDGIQFTCETNNADACAQYACMCEGIFVFRLIEALTSFPPTIDPANQASNGFNHRENCPVNSGSQTDERQCCGILPFRFPFKPVDRECCGVATFDPSLQDCCSDGVPRFSCVV